MNIDNTNPPIKGTGESYKIYRALLTQSGTDAPVATVLETTLNGIVVWARSGAGQYTGTLAGAFPANKTAIKVGAFISQVNSPIVTVLCNRVSSNTIGLITYDVDLSGGANNLDGILLETLVEVLIYP